MLNLRADNEPGKVMGRGKTLKDTAILPAKEQHRILIVEALQHAESIAIEALKIINHSIESIEKAIPDLCRGAVLIDLVLEYSGNLLSEEQVESISIIRDSIYNMFESIPVKPIGTEEDNDESTISNARE